MPWHDHPPRPHCHHAQQAREGVLCTGHLPLESQELGQAARSTEGRALLPRVSDGSIWPGDAHGRVSSAGLKDKALCGCDFAPSYSRG